MSLEIQIKITPPNAFDPERIRSTFPRALAKVGLFLEGEVKDAITPFTRTGRLRSSVTSRVSGNTVTIGTRTRYAPYVEDGTKPHTIRPRAKKALAFTAKSGKKLVVKSVRHPGFKGHHYMRDTLRSNKSNIVKLVTDELAGGLR